MRIAQAFMPDGRFWIVSPEPPWVTKFIPPTNYSSYPVDIRELFQTLRYYIGGFEGSHEILGSIWREPCAGKAPECSRYLIDGLWVWYICSAGDPLCMGRLSLSALATAPEDAVHAQIDTVIRTRYKELQKIYPGVRDEERRLREALHGLNVKILSM